MKIQRTIPPAAAPISARALLRGMTGFFQDTTLRSEREQEFKAYFGVRHVFLVSSGKAAFVLILNALASLAPDKRKVLIPAYTCYSVPSAIVKAGLEISLCDVDQETYDFDNRLLPQAISSDTLCVVTDNLFGIPADMERIRELCAQKGVFLVEDAAQAMGGTCKGKMLGTIGDVGFFSLGRGKNITCSSGGIIVTNDDRIGAALQQHYGGIETPGLIETISAFLQAICLALFLHPSLYWFPSGLPFLKLGETVFDPHFPVKRLSGMQAGLLLDWQHRLEESNRVRTANGCHLRQQLGWELGNGSSIPFLRLPVMVRDSATRNSLRVLSQQHGLGIGPLYPAAVADIPEIAALFDHEAFPAARAIAAGLLTVPTHQLLTEQDRERIVALLKQTLSGHCRTMAQPLSAQGPAVPAREQNWHQQDHYV